jgi:hypothetical protein
MNLMCRRWLEALLIVPSLRGKPFLGKGDRLMKRNHRWLKTLKQGIRSISDVCCLDELHTIFEQDLVEKRDGAGIESFAEACLKQRVPDRGAGSLCRFNQTRTIRRNQQWSRSRVQK